VCAALATGVFVNGHLFFRLPFLVLYIEAFFSSFAEGNYTDKRLGCKRLATFDAGPRVRVYYTKLTRKNIVEKSKKFVCLRYAKLAFGSVSRLPSRADGGQVVSPQ
jgi:hypothetical protein